WLGADPHVPLAVSRNGVIAAPEQCCRAWAGAGGVWTAIDTWGTPVAELPVSGGEGYDVTACWELTFEPEPPSPGILVRGDQAWSAPPSAQWEPGPRERAAALELATSIDRRFGAGKKLRPPEQRVLFFEMPGDPHQDWITTRFFAMGGRALVIAGLDRRGIWRVHHVDNTWSDLDTPRLVEPYRVHAIVDMDRDG